MEFEDGFECCNFHQSLSTSNLLDVRRERYGEEESGAESTGTASVTERVERHRLKRGYVISGAATAAAAVQHPERRLRSRIHDQLALLRATVPNLCTDEKGSILTGACEYIEKLRREEAELRCELGAELSSHGDEDFSCWEDEASFSSWREVPAKEFESADSRGGSSAAGCSNVTSLNSSDGSISCCASECSTSSATAHPTSVEVRRTEAGLRIHIECEMRPGLLLGIMELLESSGLTVEEANVDCAGRLLFDGLGLEEAEGGSTGSGDCDNVTLVSAEYLSASLRSLIDD